MRLIGIFLLLYRGYLFIVVAPARPVQGHFFYMFCRNPQLASRNVHDMYLNRPHAKGLCFCHSLYVICPILCPDFFPHIYGTAADFQFDMLSCPSCPKECTSCQALPNRHWKFVYQLDVLLLLSMVPLLLSFGGVRALR